jgi:hypothetical protein
MFALNFGIILKNWILIKNMKSDERDKVIVCD